ncbi:aminotransferase class III-fold pyridoxal phosphate-dependent enzyme [Vibrio cholerae]|nr:aminotransferase class III-fold pyridoxal phosphate-dependent enzyme [Vibrio cholerae]
MIGVELIQPGKYNTLGEPLENGQLAAQVKKLCYENGLIIETGGRSDAVLRFLPPLNISDESICCSVEILKGVLEQITNNSLKG